MTNPYIKDTPRNNIKAQTVINTLPGLTEHLKTLSMDLSTLRRLKEIASKADSDILEALSEIETLGNFNAFVNLCILDFTVVRQADLTCIRSSRSSNKFL